MMKTPGMSLMDDKKYINYMYPLQYFFFFFFKKCESASLKSTWNSSAQIEHQCGDDL